MKLRPEEPAAGPWRVEPVAAVVDRLLAGAGAPIRRRVFLAIDGRSSSGKTTLSGRIAATVEGACVVHTDDIAWNHSRFGWHDLLVRGVLEPVRRGQSVSFRPPAWEERSRAGAVEVPAGVGLLMVEGVGAGRRELAGGFDAMVWVQSDVDEGDRRNAARAAAGETTQEGVDAWMAEEYPFLDEQRPWERADIIVCGLPELDHDRATEVVVADPIR